MTKIVSKIIILQVLFLLLASSYISLGRFTDSYLSAHRTPEVCTIDVVVCPYDNDFAQWLAERRYKNTNLGILNIVPGIADNVAYSITDSRAASYLTDVFIVGFWMLLFNAILLGAWKLKQIRDVWKGTDLGK